MGRVLVEIFNEGVFGSRVFSLIESNDLSISTALVYGLHVYEVYMCTNGLSGVFMDVTTHTCTRFIEKKRLFYFKSLVIYLRLFTPAAQLRAFCNVT